MRARRLLVVGVLVAVVVVLLAAGSETGDGRAGAGAGADRASVSPSTAAVATEPSPTPVPGAVTSPQPVELAALRIDDTVIAPSGYARDLFPTWLDLDGNGCDARQDVLAAESVEPLVRDGCEVLAGSWSSLYDGIRATDPSALDVDHLVPLAEAWRSGAHAWTAERRARFANHLADPDHLLAVSMGSNRSKGDRAPDRWRPPAEGSWCRYATAWVAVKVRWDLSATTSERDALGQMLDRC